MPELTIKEILIKSSEYLKNKGIISSRHDAELLLSHFLGISRMSLYLEYEKVVSKDKADLIRNAVIDRGKRKPLQYIIGYVNFLDCVIEVNENVLIPRPETEYMVDMIIKDFSLSNKQSESTNIINNDDVHHCTKILDLCTGSGAIAIAIKKTIHNSVVYAIDICENALITAKNNAVKNNCEILFINSDLFNEFQLHNLANHTNNSKYNFNEKIANDACNSQFFFDLIISNPPYINEDDYNELQPEIFFEPKLALVAKDNGFYFYHKILFEAKNYLNEGGIMFLEIGSDQADEIKKLAEENNYSEIDVFKDLNEKYRIMRLTK